MEEAKRAACVACLREMAIEDIFKGDGSDEEKTTISQSKCLVDPSEAELH